MELDILFYPSGYLDLKLKPTKSTCTYVAATVRCVEAGEHVAGNTARARTHARARLSNRNKISIDTTATCTSQYMYMTLYAMKSNRHDWLIKAHVPSKLI